MSNDVKIYKTVDINPAQTKTSIEFGKIGYEVYRDGRIYSMSRNKFMKPKQDKDGYEEIGLWNGTSRKYYRVHRLIAELYIENKQNKPLVNHINGVKNDNRCDNLEWCTQSENEIHARKYLGKSSFGLKSSRKKINYKIAENIRSKFKEGLTQDKIGKMFSISQTQVGRVVRGEVWN